MTITLNVLKYHKKLHRYHLHHVVPLLTQMVPVNVCSGTTLATVCLLIIVINFSYYSVMVCFKNTGNKACEIKMFHKNMIDTCCRMVCISCWFINTFRKSPCMIFKSSSFSLVLLLGTISFSISSV